jgi:hypothetical protein
MWTLIIITFFMTATGGGASTTTTFLDFPDEEKCKAAASAIEVPGMVRLADEPRRGLPAGYRIIARCVAR